MVDSLGWILVGVLIIFLGIAGYAAVKGLEEENRLIEQCMMDGKKEYECKALFRNGNKSSTVMPVYVPTVR